MRFAIVLLLGMLALSLPAITSAIQPPDTRPDVTEPQGPIDESGAVRMHITSMPEQRTTISNWPPGLVHPSLVNVTVPVPSVTVTASPAVQVNLTIGHSPVDRFSWYAHWVRNTNGCSGNGPATNATLVVPSEKTLFITDMVSTFNPQTYSQLTYGVGRIVIPVVYSGGSTLPLFELRLSSPIEVPPATTLEFSPFSSGVDCGSSGDLIATGFFEETGP